MCVNGIVDVAAFEFSRTFMGVVVDMAFTSETDDADKAIRTWNSHVQRLNKGAEMLHSSPPVALPEATPSMIQMDDDDDDESPTATPNATSIPPSNPPTSIPPPAEPKLQVQPDPRGNKPPWRHNDSAEDPALESADENILQDNNAATAMPDQRPLGVIGRSRSSSSSTPREDDPAGGPTGNQTGDAASKKASDETSASEPKSILTDDNAEPAEEESPAPARRFRLTPPPPLPPLRKKPEIVIRVRPEYEDSKSESSSTESSIEEEPPEEEAPSTSAASPGLRRSNRPRAYSSRQAAPATPMSHPKKFTSKCRHMLSKTTVPFLTPLSAKPVSNSQLTPRKRSASTTLTANNRQPHRELDTDLEDLVEQLAQTANVSKASDIDLGPRMQSSPPQKAPTARLYRDCTLPVYAYNPETDRHQETLMGFQLPYRNQVRLTARSRNCS